MNLININHKTNILKPSRSIFKYLIFIYAILKKEFLKIENKHI